MSVNESNRFIVQVFVGALSLHYEALSVEASKQTTSNEIVVCIVNRLKLKDSPTCYELAEVVGDGSSTEGKERRLSPTESPVQLMLLWPKTSDNHFEQYRFYLREKDVSWNENFSMDPDLIRDFLDKFLYQPKDREYPDLCQLPDLNEQTLLDNLRTRFSGGHIYTYVGSILIALNPFKFHPIYNPKYVKLYQNCRLGSKLPPHIFAVADSAYHSMLKEKRNQCVVISGESGSGKTESTNFLLHHLTALSQKGSHGSGVEQTILSAGPVLEAFGNAKTAHNNNSSRFGKFIQVNYKENGMVHGAVVQKYLLEKSRICSQARNERNYHVFYYLLAGASDVERSQLHLLTVNDYNYLNQSGCYTLDNVDEKHEFSRLKQSMEMVGFNIEKQRRLFSVLSAVLLLGNVEFQPRKLAYHHDEAVAVCNPEVVLLISELLRVRQETLLAALCTKRAKASGETLIINYRMREAAAGRDAMAKCLYGALFDWIVLQLNHALLSKKDTLGHHQGHAIGVLDIFGFEDFIHCNSFEQLCINFANEHLQFYFNQHVFKYEQEEYRKEGIKWSDIDFMDNTGCLQLFESKPLGLLCILDDQCNFPGATNETLIQKFNSVHKDNAWYEMPPRREAAFTIRHYAGLVKYQVVDMREKNLDLMRQDIVGVLKNSNMAFVRELVGADPVAVFRWAIVRAFFRGYFAFHEAGRRYRQTRVDGNKTSILQRFRHQSPNESLASRRKGSSCAMQVQLGQQSHNRSPTSRSSLKQEGGDQVRTKLILFEGANRSQVMEKANQIVMKNKSFRPRERGKKGLKNLQSVKTLAGRTQSFGTVAKRKQPLTVTAQFQFSLHSLMDTLNMANPFFIRCIKSNANKIPNKFDDETVQRQLRYTGMLETVRIRQAGFNVRLSYDEFIQIYRILLVKGLLSSQTDIKNFLISLNLNRDNYQLGASKIFLREAEKIKLDYRLHQQIISAIVTIQRWFRACLERRRFIRWRDAATTIQTAWRCVLAQKLLSHLREQVAAVITIQTAFRRWRTRTWYLSLKHKTTRLQSRIRGLFARRLALSLRAQRLSAEPSASPSIVDDLEDIYPLRPARSSQEVRATITVGDPNSIAPHKKKLSQRRSHEESSLTTLVTLEQRRKGSCDSLASQKSSDSAGLPVKETINKAKKQLAALLRGGKKSEKWESSLQATHSDGEFDENNKNGRLAHWCIDDNLNQNEDKAREFPSNESLDVKPCQDDPKKESPGVEEREDAWHTRRDVHRHQLLRRVPAASQDPNAPVRMARKARRSTRPESYSLDIADPHSPTERIETLTPAARDDSAIGKSTSEPVRPPRDRTPVYDDNVWLTRKEPVFNRTSSDPARSSYEPPKRLLDPSVKKDAERRYSNLDPSQDLLEWNDRRTMFMICGHRFRKVSRFSSQDRCAFCDKPMDPILTQGHKCSDCKVLFHTKCIQNGGVNQMPCKRKTRKYQRSQADMKTGGTSKFSLTGTSQFTDSTDKIISDVTELRKMQSFIADKIFKMESEGNQQRNSEVDRVFRQALKEFKDNLVATYSVAYRQGDSFNIKYTDLISNFTHAMNTVCNSDNSHDSSSVTMGVNAFRGFMNEFMVEQQQPAEKPKDKKRKKKTKRNKTEENIKYCGHVYLLTIINIPTACEVCNSFFLWPLERSLVCQNCKFTCHKKCYLKLSGECRASDELGSDRLVFAVPLHRLATNGKVPLVVDRLITAIEMHGLYTEGLYRKPGVMPKVKELKFHMESWPSEQVRFEDYPVHVLASVLKLFFREMPEPLLTYDCYEDFLRATALTDPSDRISTLFSILKKLPKPNFDLMERLIFHLARVASQEESNRMSASALSIVFAPCILRTNKIVPAQDSLHDISKQTKCIETIISEQLRKVKSTLADIDTLDTACHTASHRLSSLRSSKIFSPEEFHGGNVSTASTAQPEDEDDEEALLVDHIQEIEKEKALLTSTLPSLTRTTSDDDLLSTDMDDGSLDDNYCGRANQEEAVMV